MAQVLCLLYFAVSVASNASTEYEPSTSPVKHVVLLFIAILSVASFPGTALYSLLLFSPVILLYGVANLPIYALMAAIFALSMPVVGRVIEAIVARRSVRAVAVLFFVALLPSLLALVQGAFDAIWSYAYTRGRLLMGYWHPKEAAISFAIPLILYMLIKGEAKVRGLLLLAPIMLWVIGSRNVFLTVYLLVGLWRFPRTTATLVIAVMITVIALVSYLLGPDEVFELVNRFTSLRLEVWSSALSDPGSVAGDSLLLGSRLAIDSFYVELLAGTGVVGLVAFAGWAVVLFMLLGARRGARSTARPALAAILFFGAFDSGIVSTGNLMHVTLWAIATFPLLAPRRRSRTEDIQSLRDIAGPATMPVIPERP